MMKKLRKENICTNALTMYDKHSGYNASSAGPMALASVYSDPPLLLTLYSLHLQHLSISSKPWLFCWKSDPYLTFLEFWALCHHTRIGLL